ncbi:MAG: hypothetical protein DI598_11435 [Pseudopedobacter saltans]|uniref:HTH cro/C1-type domain-containing protein n=1 Tax=Pseudopedobacter saltans TaxID=151895 RepID=A0A2W5EZS8_9SPHI|nr:MAG: hypothetical protein DI598_11435 [Pseudopedobacter saltans]
MEASEIKEYRRRNNLTQSELAEIVKSTVRSVQSWEQDQRNIPQSAVSLMTIYEKENAPIPEVREDTSSSFGANNVTMPREVFDQLSKLTETVLSQQRTIESLAEFQKKHVGAVGAAQKIAAG